MSRSQRERDYARRRNERWQARREQSARRRRDRTIAWIVIGALALTTVVSAAFLMNPSSASVPGADAAAAAEAAASASAAAAADSAGAVAAIPVTNPTLYDAPPSSDEAQGRTWAVTLQTSAGDIALGLDGAAAPQAVSSFLMLARNGFFDGTGCHRLVVGALLQCGDPTGTGTGGPGYSFGPIENAPSDQIYPAGTVAMARVGDDAASQGSQFFLVFADTTLPDDSAGGYTVMGRVTSGLDVLTTVDAGGTVDGGSDGQPAVPVTIEGVVLP